MSNLEMKVEALMHYCAAETEESRASALSQIRELMVDNSAEPSSSTSRQVDHLIRKALLTLGVPEHILGHSYLVSAIHMTVEDPSAVRSITSVIYPAIAEANGTTPSRVERCMRHAIESAWDRCDVDVLTEAFGNTIRGDKGKPTVSEFIARLANIVREQMNQYN